jgi:hypothetical protein
MKNIFIGILVICLIGAYYYFTAISDYNWHTSYIKSKQANWLLFSQQANTVNPIYFYSFFKSPVNRLMFINKQETKKIKDDIYFVSVLTADKEIGEGQIKEETLTYLIDCKNLQTGWNGQNKVDKNNINLKTIFWSKFDDKDPFKEIGLATERNECEKIKSLH